MQRFQIPGGFIVIQECRDKKQRIIEHDGVIRFYIRFDEQSCTDAPAGKGAPGKKIKAALDQIVILIGLVIGQCLQAEIPDPQTAVALGAVFKYQLHAVMQGPAGYRIELHQNGIRGLVWLQGSLIGRADRFA